MERLGQISAAEVLGPLLKSCYTEATESSPRFSSAVLHLLLVLLNMSSVVDNQPLICKACLHEVIACTDPSINAHVREAALKVIANLSKHPVSRVIVLSFPGTCSC